MMSPTVFEGRAGLKLVTWLQAALRVVLLIALLAYAGSFVLPEIWRTAALAVGSGVLFSSVGHGAGFDIAGTGRADPEAILRTVRLIGAVQ